jgi:hypothetical protein
MRTDLQMKSTLEHEKPCDARPLPGQLASESNPTVMGIHSLSTLFHHDPPQIHICRIDINIPELILGALRCIRETMNQPDRPLSSFPPAAAPFMFPCHSSSPSTCATTRPQPQRPDSPGVHARTRPPDHSRTPALMPGAYAFLNPTRSLAQSHPQTCPPTRTQP